MTSGGAKSLLCVVALLSIAPTASALQDYAMAIRDELELSDQPTCTFCHARDERGLAVDTLLGDALKNRGFSRRRGIPSLRTALRSLDQMNIDSDGDAVGDVDELRAGANPNDPSDAGLPPPDCSVTHVGAAAVGTFPPWLALAVLAVLLRQRSQVPHRRQ